ncbi:hypothetical protein HYDPIDRAFT_127870 [Hydnomerulius pinastri MD-312]|nr:hypothetical protein HYDPIDRAFT_127870 [Hydnomerulius pinastri MD-312]
MAHWFAPPSQYSTEPVQLATHNGTIYTAYDPTNPPPHPGEGYTRFVCISDTHSQTFEVPEGDVLLHSGDLSKLGRYEDLEVTMNWLGELRHPVKIIIAGNHDLPLHEDWYRTQGWKKFHSQDGIENVSKIRTLVAEKPGIIYLQDQKYTFRVHEGRREWTVYGSPWQPWFFGWAFNYLPGDASTHINKIQEVDILLTHGPPRNIRDLTLTNGHVGCPTLLAHLSKMQKPPLLHVFGHIHEARGALAHPWDNQSTTTTVEGSPVNAEGGPREGVGEARETIMVNAANMPMGRNLKYLLCGGPGFQPVIVDILDSAER